jgi:hypothetical protein
MIVEMKSRISEYLLIIWNQVAENTENNWFLWGKKFRSRKLRLMTVGDPQRWPRDTPLSTKVDTKFRRQVAVAQSV